MGRLAVRNMSNTKMPTKKPTSALAEIRRKSRYFIISQTKLFYVAPSATELNYPFNI